MNAVIYSNEIKDMIKKENRKKSQKKYYLKNKNKQIEKQRVWNKANAQYKRDYSKKYRLELKLNKI